MTSAAAGAHLRPSEPPDREFLIRLYASTRVEELDGTGWPDAEKDAFLRMQFELQARHYELCYPDAEASVFLVHGKPVGRLLLQRLDDEIRIVDVTCYPSTVGMGSGRRSCARCWPRRGRRGCRCASTS